MVIYYGVPRKSVALEWQKDLFRFLPKGQGDIKCQHVYSSFFYATLIQVLSSKNARFHLELGRNLIKISKKMLLFRKSDDFFGLRSEKVATFLDYVPKKFGGLKKKW